MELGAEPGGSAVSYVSAPLTTDTAVIGGGAVYVWVRSSTPDVDLQATVSEVRPDGNETFVQNGWIRASERKLSTGSDNDFDSPSTVLDPVPSFKKADVAPMPAGQFVEVAIPLYYEGHVYRGRIAHRVTISAPNGTQPVWSFGQTVPQGNVDRIDRLLHLDAVEAHPPDRSGGAGPHGSARVPSLRNEPCRPYQPIVNDVGAQ